MKKATGTAKKTAKAPAKLLRVMLVDDERLFRDVLKDLLSKEKGLSVIGEAGSGEEAVRLVGELQPDVILMDIGMAGDGYNGVRATAEIIRRKPGTHILMLSAYSDEMHVMEAIRAGAYGYLSKKLPPQELVHALKVFAEQGTLLPSPVMEKCVSRLQRRMNESVQTSLGTATRTQMRVLAFLGMGKSNKEIAQELGCNVKTVKNHLNVLFQKFDVKNRTEAVIKAIQAGLICGPNGTP
ncbi:MAG: response regulator transcription factor [Elusimicrobiota bacterium]|jgi:two-component system response regulator NreC